MIELELFDYLLPNVESHSGLDRRLGKTVAFAGNLSKSDYLKQAEFSQLGIHLNVYGPNFSSEQIPWSNVCYQGSFTPEEIPYQLDGSFGLIWDGTSINTCTGVNGRYMQYNNPHKLSLYIAAKLPVITWSQAAIADFITERKIGFCVDSLSDIKTKIQSLTTNEYQMYLNNLEILREKVLTGYFTKNAVKKAMKVLIK